MNEEVRQLIAEARGIIEARGKKDLLPVHVTSGNDHFLPALKWILAENNEAEYGTANTRAGTGQNPLYFAIKNQAVECVRTLLQNGADAEVPASITKRLCPLHLAVSQENDEIFNLVFNTVCSNPKAINAVSGKGNTALHSAIISKREDRALKLLEAGANPSLGNEFGNTPVFLAARIGSRELLKALVSRGADIEEENQAGENAMSVLMQTGQKSLVQLCERTANETVLLSAAEASSGFEAVEKAKNAWKIASPEVKARSVCVSEVHGIGREFVGYFTQQMETEEEKGALRAFSAEGGWDAVLCAAYAGDLDGVINLLGLGCSATGRETKLGYTPLHFIVCYKGSKQTIYSLLAKGAGLNTRNVNGQTPLHMAVIHNRLDSVEALLDNGADFLIRNKSGRTPYELARHYGFSDIAKKLDSFDKKGRGIEVDESKSYERKPGMKQHVPHTLKVEFPKSLTTVSS